MIVVVDRGGPPAHRHTVAGMVAATMLACGACTAKPPSPSPTPSPLSPTATAAIAVAQPDAHPLRVTLGTPIPGFKQPVHVASANDGRHRLFVVEQGGRVRVVDKGAIGPTPFLDVSALLGGRGGEQGLLGLAFHPDFKTNRRVFAAYTGENGDNTVAEFVADAKGDVVVGPPRVLLAIKDFASNHNGGHLIFGPDGQLWVGTGDGGGGGDPKRTGQDRKARLGKMLRIAVDAPGAPVTMWGLGLRNPWRYAFDDDTGDLWIADVGQNAWEEVNVVPKASTVTTPPNFGWSTMEGAVCFRPERDCDRGGLVPPVFVYPHDGENGCSITGGVVVKGAFVFSDYCSGRLWAIRRSGGTTAVAVVGETGRRVSSFGLGEDGGAWLVDHGGAIVPLTVSVAVAEPVSGGF